MPRLPLISGAYEARGVIANAQSCVNLVFEGNPQDAPFPATHYCAPGCYVYSDYSGIFSGIPRGMYWSSRGQFFAVVGTSLIQVTGPGPTGYTYITDIGNSGYPVSMMDNGNILCVVDGTAIPPGGTGPPATGGWFVDLGTLEVQPITDPSFNGATKVDFMDTFFLFNWPGTPTFYSTLSNITLTTDPQWDPAGAYWSEKTGYNDHVMTIVCIHDLIWVFGVVTTEIWFNAGASGFPFQRMPNAIIPHGCVSQWGATIAGDAVYWLAQDRTGRNVLMRGIGFQAQRVSNFAVETEWADYQYVSDTLVMAYQQAGHLFVVLYFQSANVTWTYDATTNQFHRRTYGADDDAWLPYSICTWGTLYDQGPGEQNLIIAGDRTGPRLLAIDRHTYTDCGTAIKRTRAWPHILNDQKRMSHKQFAIALQPGQLQPDQVSLRWSDDAGQTWGQPVAQNVTNGFPATYGQYSWRRLGYARDRVYELSWTAEGETALNGAWIEVDPAET